MRKNKFMRNSDNSHDAIDYGFIRKSNVVQ